MVRDAAPAAEASAPAVPSSPSMRRPVEVTRRTVDEVARSPGAFVYLFVLAITVWLLSSLDSHTTDVLLRSVSTNVVEMSRSAPRVLVLSAFVASSGNLLVFIVQFSIVHIPAERWLGTRRWLAVIVAGHIGASTITTVGIWLLLRTGHEDRALVYPIDVGVSYTLAAAGAALTYRWQRPLRIVWVVALAAWFRVDRLFTAPTFTDVGHACAFGIGLAVTPLLLGSSGGVRLAMPRSTSVRAWWEYVSSIAPHRPGRSGRRRWMPVAAAAALVVAVGFTVLAHESNNNTSGSTVSVPAEVVAVERTCASGCPQVRLAFRYDDVPQEVTLPLRGLGTPRVGSTRLVQFPLDHPEHAAIGRNAENIDAGGFFSLAAIASFVAALLLALRARRRRTHGSLRQDPDTPQGGAGTDGASDEGSAARPAARPRTSSGRSSAGSTPNGRPTPERHERPGRGAAPD